MDNNVNIQGTVYSWLQNHYYDRSHANQNGRVQMCHAGLYHPVKMLRRIWFRTPSKIIDIQICQDEHTMIHAFWVMHNMFPHSTKVILRFVIFKYFPSVGAFSHSSDHLQAVEAVFWIFMRSQHCKLIGRRAGQFLLCIFTNVNHQLDHLSHWLYHMCLYQLIRTWFTLTNSLVTR